MSFTVRHFAGEVTYSAAQFIEKNVDLLEPTLEACLRRSTRGILTYKGDDGDRRGNDSGGRGSGNGSGSGSNRSDCGGFSGNNGDAINKGSKSKKSSSSFSLFAKFKGDLDTLTATLRDSETHFIRCIKPNAVQRCDALDDKLVLHQLRYSGLFEAIEIRKSGYAVRLPHGEFLRRYLPCLDLIGGGHQTGATSHSTATGDDKARTSSSSGASLSWRLSDEDKKQLKAAATMISSNNNAGVNSDVTPNNTRCACRLLLSALRVAAVDASSAKNSKNSNNISDQEIEWAVGKTKVFLKNETFKQSLELLRGRAVVGYALLLQRIMRGFLARCRRWRAVSALRESALKREHGKVEMKRRQREEAEVERKRKEVEQQQRAAAERRRVAKLERRHVLLNTVVIPAISRIQLSVRHWLERRKTRQLGCIELLKYAIARNSSPLSSSSNRSPTTMPKSDKTRSRSNRSSSNTDWDTKGKGRRSTGDGIEELERNSRLLSRAIAVCCTLPVSLKSTTVEVRVFGSM
jgi:myosin heavy subunit